MTYLNHKDWWDSHDDSTKENLVRKYLNQSNVDLSDGEMYYLFHKLARKEEKYMDEIEYLKKLNSIIKEMFWIFLYVWSVFTIIVGCKTLADGNSLLTEENVYPIFYLLLAICAFGIFPLLYIEKMILKRYRWLIGE